MRKYIYFDVLPSTNDYIKENYQNLSNLDIVIAKHQTKGKGRLSRTWEDNSNSILLSMLIKPKKDLSVSLIPLVASAVVYKFLKEYLDNVKIKWPNDILVNGKKIAGILVEAKYLEKFEYLVVGIGININDEDFNKNLKEKAISLYEVIRKKENILEMYEKFSNMLRSEYKLFLKNKSDFLTVNRINSAIIGEEVYLEIEGNKEKVKVLDITDDGAILVNYNNQNKTFTSGEVTLNKNY
ncbi:MAG: biotin--[acetyl-CoA-carboxylase] ligase [Bacilli bacterium]